MADKIETTGRLRDGPCIITSDQTWMDTLRRNGCGEGSAIYDDADACAWAVAEICALRAALGLNPIIREPANAE
jgi:hypothetical protein